MGTLILPRYLPSYTLVWALSVAHSQVLLQVPARLWERSISTTLATVSLSVLHHPPLRPIGKFSLRNSQGKLLACMGRMYGK